jgi:hypothetical protein
MMEAARTSETSVDIQLRTRQYIPEDSELHTRRRENLKSQIKTISWMYTLRDTAVVAYCKKCPEISLDELRESIRSLQLIVVACHVTVVRTGDLISIKQRH